VRFNNETIKTTSCQLEALLREHGWETKTGIAVAVNQAVIPRGDWQNTQLVENDNILVITAAQGG